MEARPDLIALVGPTASGKTALALDIAERYDAEIICADSRTVYKGVDVGTAKPTVEERARVPHWGLDLVNPDERFSAADFKDYADKAIIDIRARGKLPLIVGGTGLYVDSVLYNFTFAEKADEAVRTELELLGIEQLQKYCIDNNVVLPQNTLNKRHLIRAIERGSVSDINRTGLQPNTYIVGIATNREVLRTRIVQRTEHLFDQDVEKEATILGKKYGWNSEAMTGNIYPLLKLHLEGELSLADVKDKIANADYRLAKRQMTWLRRNPDIMWADLTGAEDYLHSLLAPE